MAVAITIILYLFAAAIFFGAKTNGQQCPVGEFPCDNGTTCIKQRFQCDQIAHCADKKDESECGDYNGIMNHFLSGMTPSNSSISNYKVCDLTEFPERCKCFNRTELFCTSIGLTEIPRKIVGNPTKLVLKNNFFGELYPEDFRRYNHLTLSLSLSSCGIARIENGSFVGLKSLERLFLEINNLTELSKDAFIGLTSLIHLNMADNVLDDLDLNIFRNTPNLTRINLSRNKLVLLGAEFPRLEKLTDLNLSGNRIEYILEHTFKKLTSLRCAFLQNNRIKRIDSKSFHAQSALVELNLTDNRLEFIFEETFSNLKNLEKLDLSSNEMLTFPTNVFSGMNKLKSLGLRGINIDHISTEMFTGNSKLEFCYFKRFHYCSFVPRVRVCRPNTDGVSSMEDLLMNPILRISVWVVATLTCLGNAVVIMSRRATKGEHKTLFIFIKNLSTADFLMGVYLFAIASHDYAYRGNYNSVANTWMSSLQCTLVGILAMTSSETSLLIMSLMSVEHCLGVVSRTPGSFQLSSRAVTAGTVGVWCAGLVLALVPALYYSKANGFYGGNGVCFPLHIDEPFVLGWQYSAFVFLGLNLVSVIVICVVYAIMFISVQNHKAQSWPKLNERKIAWRMVAIVFTDCMCWVPIISLKLFAIANYPITADLYAWVVVFILPINSALNPIIYSFTTSKFRGDFSQFLTTFARRVSSTLTKKELTEDTTVETDPVCVSCKENGKIKCQCHRNSDDVTSNCSSKLTNLYVTDINIPGFGFYQSSPEVLSNSIV